MKRIHIFLFLFVTCFILNGCGAQNPSDSGPEAKDHTTATGNTTLPESTITWFNTEYFNSGDSVNMRNMLLSSQYSTIADSEMLHPAPSQHYKCPYSAWSTAQLRGAQGKMKSELPVLV